MKAEELTIALPGKFFGWGGGIEFLRHVANGLLAKMKSHRLKIYLLLPVDNKIDSPLSALRMLKRSLKGTVNNRRFCLALPVPAFHESMLDFFIHTSDGVVETVFHENSDAGLRRCLRRIKADIVLPVNGSMGTESSARWIGYLPDFQHKYLPEYFDATECFNRDIRFATGLRDAESFIVNSKAVKEDICRFYPWVDADKIFNLPFAPHPLAEWLEPIDENIDAKYDLPDKYFLISNQCWIHKDHRTAFRALKRIAETYEVSLVCTGVMNDYRHPGYSEELKQFIRKNGLMNKVNLLGHIPKRDQIEIMKRSLAVIQPTLFEGGPGGGSVYDAVSLGVPVILSDLPVNKEVFADNIWFFNAGNDEDLAAKMIEIMETEIIRPSKELLLLRGRRNLSDLGDRLLEAIAYVKIF